MVPQNHTLSTEKKHVGLKTQENAYGVMNFKTKEMPFGDRINSSFYFGLCQVRSWFR